MLQLLVFFFGLDWLGFFMNDYLMTNYQPLDVVFSHGEGVWIWDLDGNKYLDALGGIAVCGLGHAHPEVTAAICEQAGKLLHTSNIYRISAQEELAELLCQQANMSRAYFCNSGAEANEAAIKLCRLFGHSKGIDEPAIIVMEQSFHGRTLATISATGNRKVQAGFEPLVQGFVRAPFNDIEAIKNIAEHNHNIVGVMLEPIQGEGGINIPDENYLAQIRQICNERDWLMFLDEIQTGVGRTGSFYNYQQHNVIPDLVTTAKALGNGIPIGACLASGKAAELFKPGNHGSTFGGNPLVCKVATTVIQTIQKNNYVQKAGELGDELKAKLQKSLENHPAVVDIRGQGLMIGIELTQLSREILNIGLKHKILFAMAGTKVIRLLPPYIINREEVDLIVERVTNCIHEFTKE